LHLTAARLLACTQRPALADRVLLGASCHNAAEVAQAVAIGADYVTLSPVLPTASHPNEPALGWEGFADLLAQCPLPVLALGGVDDSHLPQVKALGGLGIAAISAWW
jgi:8-oxo-dGTP diphosphatase